MSFQAFRFHPHIAAGVAAAGYVTPTPIQAEAIPSVMAGRDLMGLAQTGTGKTAAFALPILQRLMRGKGGCVRALIVAPTRELAEQIHAAIAAMGQKTHIRSAAVYGGVNIKPQIQKLKSGVEIIVACPGRLLDHIGQGNIDLSRLEVLVLDEADQMFDMGFLPDIRRILKQIPEKRQTLLFSATMPADIRKLANDILRDPISVQVGSTAPAMTVAHAIYPVEQHLKTALLLNLLRHTDTGSVLVFTRTKHRAKRLGEQLEKGGFRSASLQGNLSQNRRQAALDGFRDGSYQILVATDIAARGIDVSRISHVINYDIPDTAEAYIHRIGRTGRAARTGDAFTMVTGEDSCMVRTIERALGAPLERRTVTGFDYCAPVPRKETEFARPPRQREPARHPDARGKGSAQPKGAAGSAKPKTPQKGRQQQGRTTQVAAPAQARLNQQRRPVKAPSNDAC